MKLHLPKSLLCAVLSCLASMTYSHARTFDSNQIFDSSASLTEESIINGNVTFDIKDGVTVTQETGGFNIGNHNFTLTGGGTLAINTISTTTIGASGGTLPTLTITDNSVLDISGGSINNNVYTRMRFNVTNGGVLRVKELTYGGLGFMASNTDYWVFNGGVIELTASSIATDDGPRNASIGSGVTANGEGVRFKNETRDGVIQLVWGDNGLKVNGKAIFDGIGDYATNFTSASAGIQGSGTIIKTGSGSLFLNTALAGTNVFNGLWELNQGSLIVNHASGLGGSTTINVTGNSSLGGSSSEGLQKIINVADGVALNIAGVVGGLNLSANTAKMTLGKNASLTGNIGVSNQASLVLNGSNTITGNVTVGENGSLFFKEAGAIIGDLNLSGGSLSIGNQVFPETGYFISGALNITGTNTLNLDLSNGLFAVGNLQLANSVVLNQGAALSLSGAAGTLYDLTVQNGQVSLAYKSDAKVWTGGDTGTWSNGGVGWNGSPDLTYQNGNNVFFDTTATITLEGSLTPGSVTFAGGKDVVLTLVNSTATGSDGLSGSGKFNISGAGTVVLNSANTSYSGQIWLNNGLLEINDAAALGNGKIVWNGGTIKLGDGLTGDVDISGKMEGFSDARNNAIKIDTNGHNTVWNTQRGKFSYDKYGEGDLKLNFGDTFTYAFTIHDGSITFSSSTQAILQGVLAGTGDLINDGGNLVIRNAKNTFDGTIYANTGNTFLGAANSNGGGAVSTLGANSKVVIASGAHFYMNITGGNMTSSGTGQSLGTDFFIKSGGSLRNVDCSLDLDGNIHFNVANYTPNGEITYDSLGEVTLHQHWGKYLVVKGQVSGSGIVNLTDGINDGDKDHRTILHNTSNTFNGTYRLNGSHRLSMELAASDKLDADGNVIGGVAKDAKFELLTDKSYLYISGENVTIAGLSGVAGSTLAVSGNGVKNLTIANEQDNSFLGNWGANINLIKNGSGTLTLGSFGGAKATIHEGIVDFSSVALTDKEIILTGGGLSNAGNVTNSSIKIDNTLAGGAKVLGSAISMGGASASQLTSFKSSVSADGSSVTTVTNMGNGNLSILGEGGKNTLIFSGDMVGSGATNQIFGYGNGQSGTISIGNGTDQLTVTLDLTGSAVDELLKQAATGSSLKVTNGTLTISNNVSFEFTTQYNVLGDIFDLDKKPNVSGGSIQLESKGDTPHAGWLVLTTNESLNVTNTSILDQVVGIHNNGTLNLSALTGDVQLNNLEGSSSSGVIFAGDAALDLNLGNTGSITASVYQGRIEAVNSTLNLNNGVDGYHASLLGGISVSAVNVNSGTLTLGGNSTITNALNVENNHTFGLAKDATATVGSLAGTGLMNLAEGSRLIVNSNIALDHAVSGLGSLVVTEGHTFAFNGGTMSNQTTLELNGTMDGNGVTLGALSGTGTVNLTGGELVLNSGLGVNSIFNGTWGIATGDTGTVKITGDGIQGLAGAGSDALNLKVNQGNFILTGDQTGQATYKSLDVNNGYLTIAAPGNTHDRNGVNHSTIHFTGDVSFSNQSIWTISVATTDYSDFVGPYLTSDGQISLTDTKLDFRNSGGDMQLPSIDQLDLVIAQGAGVQLGDNVTFDAGIFYGYFKDLELVVIDGNKLVLKGGENTENIFTPAGASHNAAAGSELLWNAKQASAAGGQLQTLFMTVSDMMSKNNVAAASDALASAAGSSITTISLAQNNAMRDQMGSVRNRMTYMGAEQAIINDEMPYFHMWIEGSGSYRKINQDGHDAGYTLSTWGGTVGFDVDLSDKWTLGMAFSTQIGDLDAHSIDRASGDFDSYYLSGFAKYQRRNWSHNLIVTGALNHNKWRRNVTYGDYSHDAHSTSDGYGIGAMYEANYTYKLSENGIDILQPLMGISMAHTSMDGYDETGAENAGLRVGKQDMTTCTLVAGVRYIGEMGTNIVGRSMLGELRINVAQDLGDDRGKANVAFLGNSGFSQTIRSANQGRTALQLGAGAQLPVGTNSAFFVDANADFR